MADPVVEFVADWIEENVTPELDGGDVDPDTVQQHLSALIAEAKDEGISEADIDDSGLDVPSLIEAALKDVADEGDEDADAEAEDDEYRIGKGAPDQKVRRQFKNAKAGAALRTSSKTTRQAGSGSRPFFTRPMAGQCHSQSVITPRQRPLLWKTTLLVPPE